MLKRDAQQATAWGIANQVVSRMAYKPNWHFKLLEGPGETICFRIQVEVPDVTHPRHQPTTITIEHNTAAKFFWEDGFVKFQEAIAMWIERLERHEQSEWLKFDGEYWRHPDIDHGAKSAVDP